MFLERRLAAIPTLRACSPALLLEPVLSAALGEATTFAASTTARLARKVLPLVAARASCRPFTLPWLVVLIPRWVATIASRVAAAGARIVPIPVAAIAATFEIT